VIVPVAAGVTLRVAIDSSNPLTSPLTTADTGAEPKFVAPDMKVIVPEGDRPKLPPMGFAALCVSTMAVSVIGVFTGIEVALELIVVVVAP
jgi:hypothetical protein